MNEMEDQYKCIAKRCRKECDIFLDGKPYCQQHYEQEIEGRFAVS